MKNKFYYALTISERINALKNANVELKTDKIFLDKWTSIKGLSSVKDTEELCRIKGITLDEFIYAIKSFEPFEKELLEEAAENSSWYKEYEKIMELFRCDAVTFEELKETLCYVIRPFIKYFVINISEYINNNNVKITQSSMSGIVDWLSMSLSNIPAKIVTLDLHLTKEKDSGLTYEEYMSNYSSAEDLERFYAKYPVMTRLLTERTVIAANNIKEIFKSVRENEYELASLFGIKEAVIDKISFGEGDTHSCGKSVSVIQFADGKKVIYKPKRLKVEKYFNNLIDFINDTRHSDMLDLRTCRSIWCDEYTFSEFIESVPCSNKEDVEKYYERVGQILFLMYILNGTDFHYENIISSGGYPYLIDIETLFQAANSDIIPKDDKAELEIVRDGAESVLAVGILPILGFNQNPEGKSIDISALNGKEQRLPFKVLQMKNVNTTDMVYEYDYVEVSGAQNIPYIGDKRQTFADYSDSFINGFKKMSQYVLENKDMLRSKINELFRSEPLFVRQLTKATANYATLQSYSNHPNYLSDMMYLERLFENLMAYPYSDKRIVASEIQDMLNGDIPIFFSELCSKDIYTSDFSSVTDYFSSSPLDKALNKLEKLNEDRIEKQMDMLLSSIGEKKKRRIKWINKVSAETVSTDPTDVRAIEKLTYELTDSILNKRVFNKKHDDFTWVKCSDSVIQKEPIDYSFGYGLSGLSRYFDVMEYQTGDGNFLDVRDALLEKLDMLPLKYYEKNPDNLNGLICFVNSEKYADKYTDFLIGIGRRLLEGSVKLNDKQLLTYSVLAKGFAKKTNSSELEKVVEDIMKRNYTVFSNLTPEELLYCGVDIDDIEIEKLKEYGDDILSVSADERWSNCHCDAYSDGVSNIVNNLIDIYNKTDERKYLEYARELMNAVFYTYDEYNDFRIMTDRKDCNVSLFDGLTGIAYTFRRAFIDTNLPDIFCLKV